MVYINFDMMSSMRLISGGYCLLGLLSSKLIQLMVAAQENRAPLLRLRLTDLMLALHNDADGQGGYEELHVGHIMYSLQHVI